MKILNFIVIFLVVTMEVNFSEAKGSSELDIKNFMKIMRKFEIFIAKLNDELKLLSNNTEILVSDIRRMQFFSEVIILKNIEENLMKRFENDNKVHNNENVYENIAPKCRDELHHHVEDLLEEYKSNENLCVVEIQEMLDNIKTEAVILKKEAIETYLITAMEKEAECLKQKARTVCLYNISAYLKTESLKAILNNFRSSKDGEIMSSIATCLKRISDDFEESKENVYNELYKCSFYPKFLRYLDTLLYMSKSFLDTCQKVSNVTESFISRFLPLDFSNLVSKFLDNMSIVLEDILPRKTNLHRIYKIITGYLEQEYRYILKATKQEIISKLKGFDFTIKV